MSQAEIWARYDVLQREAMRRSTASLVPEVMLHYYRLTIRLIKRAYRLMTGAPS